MFLSSLALCAGLAGPASATSDEQPNDALMHLLVEQGWVKADVAPEPGIVQQVRERASDMVLTAMNFLGVKYRRGGSSEESGFDCSGFTRYIFERSLGRMLPRRADEQATSAGLLAIKRDELKPGDLVFFNTLRRTFSHVGIYVGDGKFIHSPSAGGAVRVEDMRFSYWAQRYTGARRADLPPLPQATADLLPQRR